MINALTEFKINNKICYSHYPIKLSNEPGKCSVIVVDFDSNSNYNNIDAIPVLQFVYETLQEKYIIDTNCIVIGGTEDICLI